MKCVSQDLPTQMMSEASHSNNSDSDSDSDSDSEKLTFTPLPYDPIDSRFILTFSTSDEKSLNEAAAFFDTYGFVVSLYHTIFFALAYHILYHIALLKHYTTPHNTNPTANNTTQLVIL